MAFLAVYVERSCLVTRTDVSYAFVLAVGRLCVRHVLRYISIEVEDFDALPTCDEFYDYT